MNDRSLAISILQRARDALHARLTERILESQHEIAADAEGGSYLSEIESRRKPGSVAAMTALARALRVRIEDLVD